MRENNLVRQGRLLWLILLMVSLLASGKKQPKTYPEEGKITGTGVLEHQVGIYSHTYTVETNDKVFVLDCDKRGNIFRHTGEECGGEKKFQVGDLVHFRIDKEWFCIPVTENVSDSDRCEHKEQGEQKLRILRQQLKSNN